MTVRNDSTHPARHPSTVPPVDAPGPWAWLPLPLLLAAMVLFRLVNVPGTLETRVLLFMLQFAFGFIASSIVVFLAGRGFLVSGAPELLLLACGATSWGLAGVLATLAGRGEINTMSTMHGLMTLLAGACHLAGVVLSRRSGTMRYAVIALPMALGVTLAFVAAAVFIARAGTLPDFFVPGMGGTPLRQVILMTAMGCFAVAALSLARRPADRTSAFGGWYAIALGLIATMLAASSLIRAPGDAVSWVARTALVLAGAYMIAAAVTAQRESRVLAVALEASLRESEARFRSIVELAPDAIVAHRDGRFVYANDAALALFGAGAWPELEASPLLELVHPDDRATVAAGAGDAAAGATPLREARIVRLDGTIVPVETRSNSIVIDGRGATQVVLRDATARKAAERRARELGDDAARQARTYEAMLGAVRDHVTIFDRDGRIEYANPAQLSRWGVDLATARGETLAGLGYPADTTRTLLDAVRHVFATGEIVRTETHAGPGPGGGDFEDLLSPLRGADGSVEFVVGSSRDITDRKGAEDALRDSERRFRAAIENLPIPFFIYGPDRRIVYVNPATERMGQRPAAELVGRRDEELWPAAVTDHYVPLRERAYATGEPQSFDITVALQEGRTISTTGAFVPLLDERGQVVQMLGVAQDVTERARALETLREADAQKNQFLAVLSHELRNPLAPMKNGLYVLERAAPGGEQARRARQIIERQVDQLARLVDDLLDVTRITRGKIQLHRSRVELSDLVRRTIEDHRSLFETAGVSVEYAPAESAEVDADPNRVAQIVGNLLHNAAKFTPEGGRVTVSVRRDDAASRAAIRVHDTGIGMTSDVLERLFQPFVQADSSLHRTKGGLGLGLALVRGLTELHGGGVEVASSGLGGGSTFTVYLPLAPVTTGTVVPQPAVATAPRRRVLVIEDNVDAAESLRELLTFEGHEVAVATSGPTGIARARELQPDVVLCDIGLPGVDGYDVARALRADPALAGTRLVALSGYALPEDLQRAADAGFDRHLAKPPTLEKLADALDGGR